MVTGTSLTEHDLVEIRQALEQPTLLEAISAMEKVLASLGYVRPKTNVTGEERVLSGGNRPDWNS